MRTTKTWLAIIGFLLLGGLAIAGTVIQGQDSNEHMRVVRTTTDGRVEMAGYSSTTGATNVSEVDPLSEHHVETTPADVTNGADGTYYYYLDMDGYKALGLQLVLNGGSGTVTVTVECTLQDDGTAPASCNYHDVSNTVYGAANWTASAVLFDSNYILGQCKYVRIKVVADTSGADDADWTIFAKRLY